MMDWLIYLLKVAAIQGLFFAFYWLFLRRNNYHNLNRGYLLITLLLAFAIPFLSLPLQDEKQVIQENTMITMLRQPSHAIEDLNLVPIKQTSSYWYQTLVVVYALIALILLVRCFFYLHIIRKFKCNAKPVARKWFTLFKTSHSRPFSFFRNVFIPGGYFGTDAFKEILTHECVHARQLHSVDRLLLDFIVSLFWFNPFIYWYRNALIEIHEYQADDAVVKRYKDPIGYQELILAQLQSVQYSGLASHFNGNLIKKRIVMMSKPKKVTRWIYVLITPVVLLMVFAFSNESAIAPLEKVGVELETAFGPLPLVDEWKGGSLRQWLEKDAATTPAIFPLKESDGVKLTSGLGERKDPRTAKIKFHRGVDFKTRIGNPVLATADGEVTQVQHEESGFGLMIRLSHGEVYQTAYTHLSKILVKKGDKVKRGQVIGASGNSGWSTGPHLHYEIKKGDQFVDPIAYITDYEFQTGSTEIKKIAPSTKSE